MTGPRAQKDKDGNYIYSEKEREFPLYKYTCSNENDRTMKMLRKQFPVRLTYCMSINKAQGQTLKRVGLYLPNPVFSHGQLYVALSRVSRPENITIFVDSECQTHGQYRQKTYTKNHVYSQLLREEIAKFKDGNKYLGDYPNFDGDEESSDENYVPQRFQVDIPDDIYCFDDDFDQEEFPEDVFSQQFPEGLQDDFDDNPFLDDGFNEEFPNDGFQYDFDDNTFPDVFSEPYPNETFEHNLDCVEHTYPSDPFSELIDDSMLDNLDHKEIPNMIQVIIKNNK